METEATTELMELVLRNAGGAYLSDLHASANAGNVYRAVQAIPLEAYPLEAWTKLTNYIVYGKQTYEDAALAVAALLSFLESSAPTG